MCDDVRFQSSPFGKSSTLSGYVGGVALIMLFLMLPLIAIVAGVLWAVGVEELNCLYGGLAVAGAIVLWIVWREIPVYVSELTSTVVIRREKMEIIGRDRCVSVPWDQVAAVRLTAENGDASCSLSLDNGEKVEIPPDVAPYSEVRRALEETLLPRLVARFERELAERRCVQICEGRFGDWMNIVSAIVLFLMSPLAIVHGNLEFFGECWRLLVQGWRGQTTRLEVDWRGVRPGRGEPAPWSEFECVRVSDTGAILQFRSGRRIVASPFAENYLPFVHWLLWRTRTGAWPNDA